MPTEVTTNNTSVTYVNKDVGSRVVSVSPYVEASYTDLFPVVHTGTLSESYKTWIRTPGYHDKISKGQLLPSNPFGKYFRTCGGMIVHVQKFAAQPFEPAHTMTRYFPALSANKYPSFTPDYSEVSSKSLTELKGQSWSAGVAWAEARKTSDMIYDTATRLAKVISSLRKGHLGDAAHVLGLVPSSNQVKRFKKAYGRDPRQAAGNAWLELQYGWKPLLFDIDSAARTLARNVENDFKSTLITISVKTSKLTHEFLSDQTLVFSPVIIGTTDDIIHASYRIVLTYQPNSSVARLQSADLLNPLNIAWELIPFSFVVDWFLPIGNFIANLDATVGKTFVSGSRSVKYKIVRTYSAVKGANSSITTNGIWWWKRDGKEREVLTSFPSQSLPSFDPKLGVQRMFSSLALLSQQASHLRRG